MAIACLRFFTLARLRDFSCPCLYSCITLLIFFFAFGPYLRWLLLLELLLEGERLEGFVDERDVLRCDELRFRLLLDFLRPLLRCAALERRWLALRLRDELDLRAVAICSSLLET